MSLASQTSSHLVECAPSLKGCRICRRPGLAILPLRRSLVPKPHFWNHLPEPEISDTELGLRVLRAGYLYVLLDDSIWQAYQVTVDGYLRQFNPYLAPGSNERRLNRACMHLDHDIPASFLNIDTEQYRTASFAFSSDPWPRRVLDSYKALRNIQRMQMIDLATARDNPTLYGDYLSPDQPWILKHVYEFRDFVPGFPSVHGFHSRAHRQSAIRCYLRTAPVHPTLGPGVLAIEVDDEVGLVQEYNAMRASWAHARQVWMEEPERAYQQQTSQILLAIRQIHRQQADSEVRVDAPKLPPELPVAPGAWDQERARRVDKLARASHERLEERYDEPKRADFQKTYDTVLEVYQKRIDDYGELYARAFLADDFHVAMTHDYDPDDRQSGIAYSKTMALCLSGGISEAAGNDSGPTAMLWKQLLEDPQGPIYKALLILDKSFLAALLPSFEATSGADWNDSGKLYTVLRAAVSSDEAKQFKRRNLQEAMAQMLAALNAGSTRLKAVLGAGVECAVSRLNSASQYLYNGVSLVQLHVPMRLGDYYALQSKHIRELQHKHANGADRPRPKSRDKVQPLILGGVLSLSVMNPKIADLVVQVSVWVEGTVDELKKALSADSRLPASGQGLDASARLVPVGVGLATLDPAARKALEGLQMTLPQARKWVRTGFGGVFAAASSSNFLIAAGSLYFIHDSMGKNLENARKAIGDKSAEASLALEGSTLAVIGGGIELLGIAMEAGAAKINTRNLVTTHSVRAIQVAAVGDMMTRLGGSIVAATSFYDGVQAAFAGGRAYRAGDGWATAQYTVSAITSAVAGSFGLWAAAAKTTLLMGPLGVAVGFALIGYIFYRSAVGNESSALDRWAKRCYFGAADEKPKIHWNTSGHAQQALAALNAATMGVDAGVEIRMDHIGYAPGNIPQGQPYWIYKMTLPYFNKSKSGYRWYFIVHRQGDLSGEVYTGGEVVAQAAFNCPALAKFSSNWIGQLNKTKKPSPEDYQLVSSDTGAEMQYFNDGKSEESDVLEICGRVRHVFNSSKQGIQSVTLSMTYWPNIDAKESYAEMIITKEKDF